MPFTWGLFSITFITPVLMHVQGWEVALNEEVDLVRFSDSLCTFTL